MLGYSTYNLERSSQQAWQAHFPQLSLDSFKKIISHNLGIEGLETSYLGDRIEFEYNRNSVFYKDGAVLDINFYLDTKGNKCKIKSFSINQENQGKGKLAQFFYNLTAALDKLGIDTIYNNRTINYSFRAQSKLGLLFDKACGPNFDTTDWESCVVGIQERFSKLLKDNKILFSDKADQSAISTLVNKILPYEPKAIWLISDLKNEISGNITLYPQIDSRYETKVNKRPDLGTFLLFGFNVHGRYDLNEPDVRERMNNYFQAKQVIKLPELELVKR